MKVLEKLNLDARDVIVFEDSRNGVLSAKGAGIEKTFGILHEWNDEKELLEAGAIKVFRLPEDLNKILKELS